MRRRFLTRYNDRVGQPPGQPVFTGERAVEHMQIALMEYTQHKLQETELKTTEELARCRTAPPVSWGNITGLHDTDALADIGHKFGLHPLVVEDIANTDQRPKLEMFDDYIYLVLKMARFDDTHDEIDLEQVSLVLGGGWLLTFQEKPGDVFDPVRQRIRQSRGRVRGAGADYLAYALVDAVVDNYFLVLEALGERIELLEDRVLRRPDEKVAARIHHLKRELILLRKSIWPLREMLSGLLREEHPLFQASTTPYLRDVYDHAVQVLDTVETFRDMAAGLLDMYLSSVSNRMNEVMKVLTIIATIFIPLSFLAGVYGMNFEVMPELHLRWGYFAWLGICAVVAGGMLLYFKKKKWL